MILQPRDLGLLRALSVSVDLLLVTQVAKWWKTDVANTAKRMRTLAKFGRLDLRSFPVRVQTTDLVLFRQWNVGEPFPQDHQKVSYASQKRHNSLPIRRMQAVCLPGVEIKNASHSVGVSEIFCRFEWKSDFVGERSYPPALHGHKVKVPDALVCHEGDPMRPKFAVDYIGQYGPKRIRDLSIALCERSLPFRFF